MRVNKQTKAGFQQPVARREVVWDAKEIKMSPIFTSFVILVVIVHVNGKSELLTRNNVNS